MFPDRCCEYHMMTAWHGCALRITVGLCFFLHRTTWWRHQMETFSSSLALCAGNLPVTVSSPHKGQWRGALMFSLICAWINGWVNNREAGDWRRRRAHYDVIVMRYSTHSPVVCGMCALESVDSIETKRSEHDRGVIMSTKVSQITGVSIICLTVCLGEDQRKHQSSTSLAFVRGIHRWQVGSPHKGPVTRKMFPFWRLHHEQHSNYMLRAILWLEPSDNFIITWKPSQLSIGQPLTSPVITWPARQS